jgi:hypothetical protein
MIRKRSKYGYILALCVVAISYFCTVVLNQKNYQDAWILDGIVVPTAIFVFFFLFAETFIQENKKLVVLAAFFLAAINLVPGLKYQLFCGVFDAPSHFRFTNEMVSLGHIPENEYISEMYGSNPAMHIFMACASIISGFSVNDVLRFIVPALSGLIPFIIYFITKDILDNTIQRYVIIASSFPIVHRFITYGTSLAMLPYFLLIAIFLHRVFAKIKGASFWLIFVILSLNLVISHAVTSLFVSFIFVATLVVLKSLEITRKRFLGGVQVSILIVPSLLYLILFATWWLNTSEFNLNKLVDLMRSLFLGEAKAPVPTRFHKMPLLPQLQILAVFHSRDAIITMLGLLGLAVFLRKIRRNELSDKTKTFYLYILVLLSSFVLFLSVEFITSFGSIEYERFIAYAMPLCVFLVGLTLWGLDKFLRAHIKLGISNMIFASFLFILVSSCFIQFYHCQPLVPRSNVLSSDLPENEYVYHFGVVNTIYQVEMISFAEMNSYDGRIATDVTTRFQIRGFAGPSFYSRQIWYSPLETNENLKWDLFLLHTVEAGALNEPAEYRTSEIIENLRLEAGNLIYDNGASFIISNTNSNQD